MDAWPRSYERDLSRNRWSLKMAHTKAAYDDLHSKYVMQIGERDQLARHRTELVDALSKTQQMLGEANAKAKMAASEAAVWEKKFNELTGVSAEDQRIIAHLRGQIEMLERLGMIPKPEPEQSGYQPPHIDVHNRWGR